MNATIKPERDAFNISWYARNFGMDRRTVADRIKRARLREARIKGKGRFYYVNEVMPLLVLAGLEAELRVLGDKIKAVSKRTC